MEYDETAVPAVHESTEPAQPFMDELERPRRRSKSGRARSPGWADVSHAARSTAGGAQSVDRACDILLTFSLRQTVLTLGEISEKSNLPKPTAHRLIQSLVSRGLMQRTPEGRYELGYRMLELGSIARAQFSLGLLAKEAMETLAAETGETVILSRADFDALQIIAIESRTRAHALGVRPLQGWRPLIPPGPQAKSILAALAPSDFLRILNVYAQRGPDERQLVETGQIQREIQRTRQRGYAVDEQDYIVGVTGVTSWIVFGTPLRAAALGVVGPSERLSGARIERVGSRIRELAVGLSFSGVRELPVGG